MKRLYILLITAAMAASASAFTVTGTLTDAEGKPMKKVRVSSVYSLKSDKTDKNGRFSVNCKEADTLVIIDKKKMIRLPMKGEADINISFGKEMATITCGQDVSFYAYMDAPKPERRGSGLSGEVIARRNPKDIWELLDGGLAGVRVEGQQVTIRGIHSINCSLEPLFIIDGIEYTSSLAANQALNINEISSVEVNKDGLGYGIKGANGVIIFHYKSGK